MIEDGAAVYKDGDVECTFKYLENLKDFSSKPAEQSGYYFPFITKNKGSKVTIKKNGRVSREEIEFPDDNTFIFRVDDKDTTFEVIVDSVSVITLNFKKCVFTPKDG